MPDFVKKQWEGTKAMKTGRTEAQRSIINAAFDRSTGGKLILSLEKPVFQSARAQYQDKSSSSIEKSLPKTLFCGKFNLSPELLAEGLAAGDFQQVDVGGRAQYVWASSESKITKGDRSEVGLKAEIQGKKDDGAKFEEWSSFTHALVVNYFLSLTILFMFSHRGCILTSQFWHSHTGIFGIFC